jgi:isoquinoline 1-oxidoreductase subunit beta
VKRRAFLSRSVGVGGGWLLQGRLALAATAAPNAATESAAVEIGYFLKIGADNLVHFQLNRHEMGQGVSTGLATVLAEELDVPWDRLRVEWMPFTRRYNFGTGGSASMLRLWEPLRKVGAQVRQMLVQTAAERWQVPASECATAQAEVVHLPSQRRLSYGELAAQAARLPVPPLQELIRAPARLKEAAAFQLVGRDRSNVTAAAIVDGALKYTLDHTVQGMVHAVIARCPVMHGKLLRAEVEAARRVAGVIGTAEIEGYHGIDLPGVESSVGFPFVLRSGVAVWADSMWSAIEGRKKLKLQWDTAAAPAAQHDNASFRAFVQAASAVEHEPTALRGPAADAPAAPPTLQAAYEYPYQAHALMEPLGCIAHWHADGRCELWLATQAPGYVAQEITRKCGIAAEHIQIHLLSSGGSFGRRFFPDFVIEAMLVSRAAGHRPVKLMWTREDEFQTNHYHPHTQMQLAARLAPDGRIASWHQREARTQFSRRAPGHKPAPPQSAEMPWLGYAAASVPVRYELLDMETHSALPSCSWRSVVANAWAFGQECFVDELAALAGQDPLDFRLTHLEDAQRDVGHAFKLDTSRLRRVLEVVAERTGWRGGPRQQGLPPRARGIAAYPYLHGNSYCAVVVEVEAAPSLRVLRVVCAADCGLVVNPSTVRQQLEGGIVWALTAALHGGVAYSGGRVSASNFHEQRVMRINECPEIEIHLVDSGLGVPTGVGELSGPATVPALCNAFHAATGRRVRRLPIQA